MKKFLYDRMVEELSKKTKEELIQEIMSLQEIETKDRCFANEVMASSSAGKMNEIFRIKRDLDKKHSYRKADQLVEAIAEAEGHWNFIMNRLEDMNDPSRVSTNLEDFKIRVSKAEDKEDCI